MQNNDDNCLAYTLAAICDLMSEIGVPSRNGMIGSSQTAASTGLGTLLSTQQQLLVLLQRSLKRADSLKLTRLVALNHLALAKFDLKVTFYCFKIRLLPVTLAFITSLDFFNFIFKTVKVKIFILNCFNGVLDES